MSERSAWAVIVDMPKDIQLDDLSELEMDPTMELPGYDASMPIVQDGVIGEMAAAIGKQNSLWFTLAAELSPAEASSELAQFLAKRVYVTTTVMGIGAVPPGGIHWIGWGCMAHANMLSEIAILIALGVRFDDR